MNILTQFQKIITKNVQENFNNYLHNLISSFHTPYNIGAYQQFIEDFDTFTSSLNKEAYETFILALDEEFMQSHLRRQQYSSRGFVTKPLLTKFGYINLKRRRYEDKINKRSFMFVDRLLGLEKYTRIDPFVIADLCEEATTTSYAKAGRIVSKSIGNKIKYNNDPNKYILSRATTRNIVLKASKIMQIPKTDKYKEVEVLNIMLDEKFVGSQFNEGKDHMIKAAVLFEGTNIEYGKRVRLTGKHVFGSIEEGINDLLNEVLDYIYYKYDTDKLKRINFMGDGALWIKSFSFDTSFKYHKDIILKYGLNSFHCFQAIQNIVTNKHKEFTEYFTNYLFNNNRESFILLCEGIINIEPLREKQIKLKMDYILNNWNHIQTAFHDIKYKCSMESNISHVFADIFTSRPKAYSKEGLRGLLKLRLLKINGYDLKELYFKSLKTKIQYKKNETLLNKICLKNNEVSDELFSLLPITKTSGNEGRIINLINNSYSI